MRGLRAVSVFEGAGSKLFDGHVIEVGGGRAWCAAWSFFGGGGASTRTQSVSSRRWTFRSATTGSSGVPRRFGAMPCNAWAGVCALPQCSRASHTGSARTARGWVGWIPSGGSTAGECHRACRCPPSRAPISAPQWFLVSALGALDSLGRSVSTRFPLRDPDALGRAAHARPARQPGVRAATMPS